MNEEPTVWRVDYGETCGCGFEVREYNPFLCEVKTDDGVLYDEAECMLLRMKVPKTGMPPAVHIVKKLFYGKLDSIIDLSRYI